VDILPLTLDLKRLVHMDQWCKKSTPFSC